MQRLERLTTKQDVQALIFHDEGDEIRVRALARRARRAGIAGSAFGMGHVHVPFRGLLDDPVSRRSHESLFLQLSDLVAYAAFRRVFPPPSRPVQIVPELMWDELGASALAEVNQRSGGPSPGIVAWPRPKEKSPLAEALREDLHRAWARLVLAYTLANGLQRHKAYVNSLHRRADFTPISRGANPHRHHAR